MKSPTPEQIKQRRKECGVTQRELAEIVHASIWAVRDWEQGKYPMHPGLWELFQRKRKRL